MVLTAWKTNAYADEEQPPRHGWERISLVRGVALGGWRVHIVVLHLLLLEYIGVELSLRLLTYAPACCYACTGSRPSSSTTITVFSRRVSLTAHSSQSAASFLDQSTSKLFPAPKPSRQGGGRPALYIHPPLHPSLNSVEPPPPSQSPTACIRPSGPWITTRKINN